MKVNKIVSIPFLFISSIFLLWALSQSLSTYKLVSNSTPTTGEVIDVNCRRFSKKKKPFCTWTIEFKTELGKKIEFKQAADSYNGRNDIGKTIEVIYNSDNPEEASINSFKKTWGLPLSIFVFSILSGVIGLVVFLKD